VAFIACARRCAAASPSILWLELTREFTPTKFQAKLPPSPSITSLPALSPNTHKSKGLSTVKQKLFALHAMADAPSALPPPTDPFIASIIPVDIDPVGVFKYVLIKVVARPGADPAFVVRGHAWAEFHDNVYQHHKAHILALPGAGPGEPRLAVALSCHADSPALQKQLSSALAVGALAAIASRSRCTGTALAMGGEAVWGVRQKTGVGPPATSRRADHARTVGILEASGQLTGVKITWHNGGY